MEPTLLLVPFLPQVLLLAVWFGGALIGLLSKPRMLELLILASAFGLVTVFLLVLQAH